MSESQMPEPQHSQQVPQLNAVQRRILGVLVEKAKTTPQNYPLTLNALTAGCNQKSNRSPKMDLDPDDCLVELDELRKIGAVTEVHGDGRAAKYKHRIYEWLEVSPDEAAVMSELLLRGAQTLGDLRARASRMAKIPDLASLKSILDGLIERGLVVALTPPGRGQIVTHGMYLDREWDKVRDAASSGAAVRVTGEAAAAGLSRRELEARVAQLEDTVRALQQRVDRLEGGRQGDHPEAP